MCWQMALALGTEALGHVAGVKAADQQNQYYMNNAAAANADAVEKYAAEQLAIIQKEEQAAEQRMTLARSGVEAKGAALASSENFGQSANQVLHDIERQRARQSHNVDVNIENERIQSQANIKAINAENANRINSVATAEGPDLISTVLSGLGAVAGAAGSGSKATKDTGSASVKPNQRTLVDMNYVDPMAITGRDLG